MDQNIKNQEGGVYRAFLRISLQKIERRKRKSNREQWDGRISGTCNRREVVFWDQVKRVRQRHPC